MVNEAIICYIFPGGKGSTLPKLLYPVQTLLAIGKKCGLKSTGGDVKCYWGRATAQMEFSDFLKDVNLHFPDERLQLAPEIEGRGGRRACSGLPLKPYCFE